MVGVEADKKRRKRRKEDEKREKTGIENASSDRKRGQTVCTIWRSVYVVFFLFSGNHQNQQNQAEQNRGEKQMGPMSDHYSARSGIWLMYAQQLKT